MEITEQEINHLAELSNLSLSAEEKAALKTDLGEILQYISKLDKLNVENVEPTFQVSGLKNIWRADEILPEDASPEELLALAPDSQEDQIKVPKVL